MPIRVLLAEDSEILRKAIARLLKDDSEIELVAETASFLETVQLTNELQPQVVVMDLHMSDEKYVTPSQVKSSLMGTRLLGISFWNDEETKALADSFGVVNLLDKANLVTELIPAIKQDRAITASS